MGQEYRSNLAKQVHNQGVRHWLEMATVFSKLSCVAVGTAQTISSPMIFLKLLKTIDKDDFPQYESSKGRDNSSKM